MSTLIVAAICRMPGRLLVTPFLLLFLFLSAGALAAAVPGSGEPLLKNAWDIGVIDKALATVKPGQQMVPFGDVGIKPDVLRAFRQKLVDEQGGSSQGPSPMADTPPGTAFKWPSGTVPYRFDPTQVSNGTITAAKMQQFRDAVAEWAASANVHFNEFTGATPPNFVTVQENASLGGGFSSSVGMAGGEQFVQFGPQAWNRGTVCHEVGHAIGYYHEQQRDDRDTYVVILTQNIIPGQEGNFAKLPGGSVAQGAYDFYSVMHYARNALSIDPDNLDTIEPQPAYSQFLDLIGQVYYRTLSKLDRAGMALVYGNPSPLPSAVVTNTKDSGSGSLRAALYYAFDKSTDIPPVPTTVVFNIPTSDPGFANNVFTIKPTYLLVAPGAGTTIDGSTQTAFTGNTNPNGPEVVLDGSQITVQNLFAAGPLYDRGELHGKKSRHQQFQSAGDLDCWNGRDRQRGERLLPRHRPDWHKRRAKHIPGRGDRRRREREHHRRHDRGRAKHHFGQRIYRSFHSRQRNEQQPRAGKFYRHESYGHCGDSECLPGHRDFWRRAEQYHRQRIERRWAQRDFRQHVPGHRD